MITLEELKMWLWQATDILRGAVALSDYKDYVSGLLFLKYLSDVFEEEAQRIEEELGNHDLAWNEPDEHKFFVPARARWSNIATAHSNIGYSLNVAMAALEEANVKLRGLLLGIDFNDERKLGKPRQRDQLLGNLILHFSKFNLYQSNLADANLLGEAYEWFLASLSESIGRGGGYLYTSKSLVKLLVRLLEPDEGMRICDPVCGSGEFLVECSHYIQRKGGNSRNISLFGQEQNLNTWITAQMNMILNGVLDFDIRQGNIFEEPAFVQQEWLMLFDRIIANPPFNLDRWGHETAEHDRYNRFRFGLPPKNRGDYAFIQHILATLNKQGRAVVVVPHGVLFRGGVEGRIRQGILRADSVETIIGLGSNLLHSTSIPIAVLILNQAKPDERRGKLLFIDASREYESDRNLNYLNNENITHIFETYQGFVTEEAFSKVVSLDEVKQQEYNLNISLYVKPKKSKLESDLKLEMLKVKEIEAKRLETEAEILKNLHSLGIDL